MRTLTMREIECVAGSGDYCGPQDSFWSTFVPDAPLGYDFGPACQRHDENYSAGSGLTRAQADDIFRTDMRAICATQYDNDFGCRAVAFVYFTAVVEFGQSSFQGNQSAASWGNGDAFNLANESFFSPGDSAPDGWGNGDAFNLANEAVAGDWEGAWNSINDYS